ncbi:MAG: hypothetical protein ABFQ65_01660 [Nanoarchaeota archaeon]
MTKKKNTTKTFASLGILGIVALLGMSMVFAYQGDSNVKGPYYSEDRHEAMEEIFETGDYDAWVVLMTESGRHPRILDIVTEENFEVFVEAHEAMENGNMELAHELRAELGLGQGRMIGKGVGLKDGSGMNRQGMYSGEQGYNGDCAYAN